MNEANLNGFPSSKIAERLQEDPYRLLVCADKFQTGYDEPLLHTMYVDKTLSGIKAVQTLSRLNRAHPKKHDTFVLDFMNTTDVITESFTPFYRGTALTDETDPNKLHDLMADLDAAQVYSDNQIENFARLYLGGADRDQLDPMLDTCIPVYKKELDEDGQVAFKSTAKIFVRTYAFLASILAYTNQTWETHSIFLNFLIPKLPSPPEEDLSKGILDAIDMDSYRIEKQAMQKILLPDDDAEIDPVPTSTGGGHPEPELDRLSNIITTFNDLFGDIPWEDGDRVKELITETIPSRVAVDTAFRKRPGEFRPGERSNRARQGARQGNDLAHEGRHPAIQALHGRRRVQTVDDRHRVHARIRPVRGRNSRARRVVGKAEVENEPMQRAYRARRQRRPKDYPTPQRSRIHQSRDLREEQCRLTRYPDVVGWTSLRFRALMESAHIHLHNFARPMINVFVRLLICQFDRSPSTTSIPFDTK